MTVENLKNNKISELYLVFGKESKIFFEILTKN